MARAKDSSGSGNLLVSTGNGGSHYHLPRTSHHAGYRSFAVEG